jgi:hypothetical protein
VDSSAQPGVTLQISLAPNDLPHAVDTVPHQLRRLGGQVENIDLTLDLHRSGGRYGSDWEGQLPGLERFLEGLVGEWPKARVCRADYSPQALREVGEAFFNGAEVPPKAGTGAPMHSYFWALLQARDDHVFHVDSDVMFGGGSQTWVREAVELLARRDDVILCSPLPGPPRPDGELPDRVVERMHRWGGHFLGREPLSSLAYRLGHASSRLFFAQRSRILADLCPLPLLRGSLRERARWRTEGGSPYEIPEHIMTAVMRRQGLVRVDFLGEAPGLWSLHPVWRTAAFHRELPRLIERVESGDMPEEQLGDYDIVDSLVDDYPAVRAEVERSPTRRERIAWRLKLARALLRPRQ